MGWVKVYEYNLGFGVLHTLIQCEQSWWQIHHGGLQIAKLEPTIEKLTIRAMKVIKYLNLYISIEGLLFKKSWRKEIVDG
jgi:hypothetical protein